MFELTSAPSTICVLLFCFLLFGSVSCITLENIGSTEYAALMAFKSKLILEPDNILSINWTSNTNYCTWFGVSCFNHRVTNIALSGLALRGELSPKIAKLTHLEELDLNSNKLGGFLSSEFGSLQQLRILILANNSLQGGIPANLSRCWKLQILNLADNLFAGSISEELGYLRNLQLLALDRNNLTGNIPTSFGNFSELEVLYLYMNDLDGAIPSELGKLTRLLDLRVSSNNLVDSISDSFGNFSRLEHLNLEANNLYGTIPSELGKLTRLSFLSIGSNNLIGTIPPPILNISSLQRVYMRDNELSGKLPENLGAGLPNLEYLSCRTNRITGKIPISLCNATKLADLYLYENDLQGEIPNELSRLLNLRNFDVGGNRINGGIPHVYFNITSLENLDARDNYLSGNLPRDLGNGLPNLQRLALYDNQFSGEIPSSICNATKIMHLGLSNNSFSGPIPMMLGNLVYLEGLMLELNPLINNPASTHLDFLKSLVNCPNLWYLALSYTPLNGNIPESVGNLSTSLERFTAVSCGLKGSIPHGFGNLSSLIDLRVPNNELQGSVPLSFAGLRNLEYLDLSENRLDGFVTTVYCDMHIMGFLYLDGNNFSGSIPICFQNLTQLREISLAANKLNSIIPLEFWKSENVQVLNLYKNLLYGSIPIEVGNLKAITTMDFSSNVFYGEIPNSIGSLQNLVTLDMSRNKFEGPIPNKLETLILLQSLDLSLNGLSGDIPPSLGSLQDLQYLNISFNRLQGEIPMTGVFANITFESLMGNPNLCGAPKLNFPVCLPQASGRRKRTRGFVLKITVPIAVTSLLVFTVVLLWMKFSRKHPKNATKSEISLVEHRMITYHELLYATENFSVTNFLGEGCSGMVYKAVLSDGTVVAIKVFNMQHVKALRNFTAECEVLRNVRHRNLVKIISTCTNPRFKAMILEYMSNGSLDMSLHSQNSSMSLAERLNIVIDVALGMEYLHHDHVVPIVHCDLKPANVLLDEDMTAHVADFGISKILAQDQEFVQTNTLGTIGYTAPEYGLDGHASTMGDVYSFGILLLETFTGKRPTDDMFKEGLSLHIWVHQVFPDALVEVLDPNLFADINSSGEGSFASISRKQQFNGEILVSIIQVALLCLKELPGERIDMRTVAAQLKKTRAELEKINKKKSRKST